MIDNLICITGNSGAGKSIVSLAIANYLSNKKNKIVLLLSPDLYQPMLPVYIPFGKDTYNRNKSIGDLFLKGFSKNNTSNLIGKINIHPQNNNLGFLCYAGGDNILRYSSDTITNDKLFDLVNILKEKFHFDYLIIDCNTYIEDCTISSFAVSNSLKKIFVMSPDNKGVSYMTSREIFNNSKSQLIILNNCYNYSPYKELQNELKIKYALPHSKNAYEHFLTGDTFDFNDGYTLGIKQIAEEILK